MKRFKDRADAGKFLARLISEGYPNHEEIVLLALPRGGVPVAREVAREFGLPFDVFLVRKLGFPGREEFALGAIASGGVCVLNSQAFGLGNITEDEITRIVEKETLELERREHMYRGTRPMPQIRGKIVILVDDGLATGSTMRAAIQALRQLGPKRIVVAAPVGSADACEILAREADEVTCGSIPEPFQSVGQFYLDFSQTSDEEVRELLEEPHFAE